MDKYVHIRQDFQEQEKEINRQIDRLSLQQLDIQKHVAEIELDINSLRQSIDKERDPVQRGKLYGVLNNKLQLLAHFYELLKDYELVKTNYYRNVSALLVDRHRLLEVDIRKLDERLSQYGYGDVLPIFEKVNEVLKEAGRLEDKYEL